MDVDSGNLAGDSRPFTFSVASGFQGQPAVPMEIRGSRGRILVAGGTWPWHFRVYNIQREGW